MLSLPSTSPASIMPATSGVLSSFEGGKHHEFNTGPSALTASQELTVLAGKLEAWFRNLSNEGSGHEVTAGIVCPVKGAAAHPGWHASQTQTPATFWSEVN
jgi:hypothetical protein